MGTLGIVLAVDGGIQLATGLWFYGVASVLGGVFLFQSAYTLLRLFAERDTVSPQER